MNRELWTAVEPSIRHAQKGRTMHGPNGSGWISDLYSPLVAPGDDTRPSFSVKPDDTDGGAWKDFGTDEGGSLLDLAKRLGMDIPANPAAFRKPEDAFFAWCRNRSLDPQRLSLRWDCKPRVWFDRPAFIFPTPVGTDRVRYLDGAEPKTKWRKRGGKTCWYGLDKAQQLLSAEEGTLYIVNGEPSVWACDQSEVAAVCTCMSEDRTPKAAEVKALAGAVDGRRVAVVFDVDEPGRAGARKMVAALRLRGIDAVALALPEDLGEHGDVDDLHRRVGDDGLADALADLPELEDEHEKENSGLPMIIASGRQLPEIITDAWAAIHKANVPPRLFQRVGNLVRLVYDEVDDAGQPRPPRIDPATQTVAYGFLARTARWCSYRGTGEDLVLVDRLPLREAAADLLAFPDTKVPHLEAVVTSPVLDRAGEVVSKPGYHESARLWLHGADDFKLPKVSARPTSHEIDAARDLLLNELLVDFPFVGDADQAHAMALVLLPVVRRLVPGCTPLHLVEAPCPGSGKGLLVHLAAIVTTAMAAEGRTLPTDDNEVRKMLTAELVKGRPIILLDNASEKRELDSPSLVSVLTSEVWTDRYLGLSQMVSAVNKAVWILTGNNPRMSLEMARRCVRIRIDPRTDRPWKREGFRHDPVADWAKQNRARLVWACLTIGRAWVAAGRPLGRQRLGSFEGWAGVMGGMLAVAGVKGFLGNLEELYEAADTQGQEWRSFIAAWWDEHKDKWLTAAQLHELAVAKELLMPILGDRSERSQRTKLGRALGTIRDRRFGAYTVVRGEDRRNKVALYRLVEGDPAAAEAPPGEQGEMDF